MRPIEYILRLCTTMEKFAEQLADVRALDTKRDYTTKLYELEKEYKFILLRSLDNYNKEILRSKLPERLHIIKEYLSPGAQYPPHSPFTLRNERLEACQNCKGKLTPMMFSSELCCEDCGLLEPLVGVTFDYNELYGGDYKITKKRRPTKRYNFKTYLKKYLKICKPHFSLSNEQIQHANDSFKTIEEYLPKRISMPFFAHKILIAINRPQRLVNYFWLQVPEKSMWKHEESWRLTLEKMRGV